LVVAHLEWPLMRVLPLSLLPHPLLPKSDQRVYVDVYALRRRVGIIGCHRRCSAAGSAPELALNNFVRRSVTFAELLPCLNAPVPRIRSPMNTAHRWWRG